MKKSFFVEESKYVPESMIRSESKANLFPNDISKRITDEQKNHYS
jgi:hypothetical protein